MAFERVRLPDGGTVCFQYSPSICKHNTPLLFILETFNGELKFPVAAVEYFVNKLGWNVVTMHRRGVHYPLTSMAEHAGCDEDVKTVLGWYILVIQDGQIFFFFGWWSYLGSISSAKYQPKYAIGAATISSLECIVDAFDHRWFL